MPSDSQHSIRRKCWFAHSGDVSTVNRLLMDASFDTNIAIFALRTDFLGYARITSPFRQTVGSAFMSCEVRHVAS
jgi:hypothetical protein